jgi:hypothetical protein
MPVAAATIGQIRAYEEVVTQAWGGGEKLAALFNSSPDYKGAFDDAVSGRYSGSLATLVP